MATNILQWNIRGLRCNRRDFDILVSEHQPDVVWLQEIKLEHLPASSHYRCKSLRRNPDQLPCGGVSIYIKKGLYHHQVQIDSHLQAVAVQVTLGDTPVTILSVYIPSNNHLTSKDLSYLTRNIRGQILMTGDFNGHIYGAVTMLTPGVRSLRDSLIKTICVFSMTEPTLIWNPKLSTWINQRQR